MRSPTQDAGTPTPSWAPDAQTSTEPRDHDPVDNVPPHTPFTSEEQAGTWVESVDAQIEYLRGEATQSWAQHEATLAWAKDISGDVQHVYSITLVVGRTADRQNQKALYEFMGYSGDRSIRAAIEGDRTLGGRVQTLLVERADNIQFISQGDASYLSCDFRCRIHA